MSKTCSDCHIIYIIFLMRLALYKQHYTSYKLFLYKAYIYLNNVAIYLYTYSLLVFIYRIILYMKMLSLYRVLYFIYESRENICIDMCVQYIKNAQY